MLFCEKMFLAFGGLCWFSLPREKRTKELLVVFQLILVSSADSYQSVEHGGLLLD